MPPTLDPTAAARDFIRRWEKFAVERAAEERRGLVRWLRPEFQNPQASGQTSLHTGDETAVVTAPLKVEKVDWPKSMADQAKAVRAALVARGEVLTASNWQRASSARAWTGWPRCWIRWPPSARPARWRRGGMRRSGSR